MKLIRSTIISILLIAGMVGGNTLKFKVMKIKLFFLFILICGIANAQAPNWLWATGSGGINDDLVKSVTTDETGNVYAVGSFSSDSIVFGSEVLYNSGLGTFDLFITKYDASGNVLWARSAGGSDSDYGFAVTVDSAGNVCVGGSFQSNAVTFGTITLTNTSPFFSDFFLVKYDCNGYVLWAISSKDSPGNDAIYSICTDKYSNVFVTGPFQSDSITFGSTTLYNAGAPNLDFYIVKFNSSGNVVWAKSIGGYDEEAAKSICTDANGNLIAGGYFFSPSLAFGGITLTNYSPGTADLFIAKYDSAGNVLWAKSAGGDDSDYGSSVAADNVGNVFIGGSFRSNSITFNTVTLTNTGPPYSDICLVKYNASGNVLWAKSSKNSPSSDATYSICADDFGNVFITGPYQSETITFGSTTLINAAAPNLDFYIVKFNSTGNVLWTKGIGNHDEEAGNSICTYVDGNLFAGGYFYSSSLTFGETTLINSGSGTEDVFVAKISSTNGINEIVTDQNIILYPNPASSQLTIDLKNFNSQEKQVEIYTVEGKMISEFQIRENKIILNVKNYPSGVYIIKIKTDKLTFLGKFCKEWGLK